LYLLEKRRKDRKREFSAFFVENKNYKIKNDAKRFVKSVAFDYK